MKTMLWDINVIPNGAELWAASDVSLLFHHLSHHPMTLAVGLLCWCFGFLVWVFLFALSCFCFLFCKCHGISNPPRVLDLDDRQGLIASSAMQ